VPDLGEVAAFAYTGEATWIGYEMVDGRWYGATDEVVVSTRLFDLLDLAVGDRLTLASGTLSVDVTVAGTVFDIEPDIANHLLVRGDATAFSALGATPVSTEFEARPVEGHSSAAVVASLSEAGVPAFVAEPIGNHETVLIVRTTIVALGAVLLAVAIAGVANTVLLDVAERARESAILGALGMTPAQRRRVAVTAVLPLGVVGGMAGIPIGGTLANWVLVEMGRAGGGTRVPEVILDPLGPAVACLALVGVVVAGIGAWVPAGLAARRAIAPDLRAE
jgi:putative ABC transport system permease protein